MPDDAAWRDDLRSLLDQRWERLAALAGRRTPDPRDADPEAYGALVAALVRVFTAHHPASEAPGAVRGSQAVVVVDDDAVLDDLERAVGDALARAGRVPDTDSLPAPRPAADPLDELRPAGPTSDATDRWDAPPPVLAAVETRVASARRTRTGRRRVVGAVSAGIGAFLVAGVLWSAGYGPGHGSPAPTATVAEDESGFALPMYPRWTPVGCRTELAVRSSGTGALALHVRGGTSRIGPADTWTGRVSVDTNDMIRSHAVLAGPVQVVLVDVHGTPVAAVGVGDVPRIDLSTRPAVQAAVRLTACNGSRPLDPGTYDLVAVQHYQDRSDGPYGPILTATSAPVRLAVARAASPSVDAGAEQPPWLIGTPLVCGMTTDALVGLPGYFPQYLDVLAPPRDGPPGLVVRNAAGGPAPITTGRQVALAWVRHGRVVSVGPDVLADPATRVVPVGGQALLPAALDTTDRCRPSGDGSYPRRLAAGTYLAYPYAQVVADRSTLARAASDGAPTPTLGWLVGEPRRVVVGADGSAHPAQ
ncbi:hypothetical protein ACFT5B_02980 [Luteimicrobium sp. NPDC057192]|uniref:hypothetical protein n=1 Tax=Luteimicrobium sp. NPDC057192 TaxID=3346042 RepID=UPI00363B4166